MRVPAGEATTAHLGAAHPFAASPQTGATSVLVGRDLLGGSFVHDPFELYERGVLTNPNVVVLGQIGRGKSALVKTYLFRHAAFGRRVLVLDPKGEYGPLAAALGTAALRLEPGGALRLNPLEPPSGLALGAGEIARRRSALVGVLASSCLQRPLVPIEHAAIDAALEQASSEASVLVLPVVVEALADPDARASASLGLGAARLRDSSRDLALALRRLVSGDLRGMLDGPTSPGLRLEAPAVVVDLAAVYRSAALPAVMACVAALLEHSGGVGRRLLVFDEAWAVLGDPATARMVRSSWKLARSSGTANVAVVHRVSDLAAAGEAGSAESRIAEGLLADSETLVCYGLPALEAELAARALGLHAGHASLLSRLPRGVALWRVAGRCYLVEHRLSTSERALVDTDARLREPTAGPLS